MQNENPDQTTPDNSNDEQPANQDYENSLVSGEKHRSYERKFMDGLEKK